MHDALAVPEIVRLTFQEIALVKSRSNSTFLSLALVQRSWTSLALDYLWETLSHKNIRFLIKPMGESTSYKLDRGGHQLIVSLIVRLPRSANCHILLHIQAISSDAEIHNGWITPRFLNYCRRIRHIRWPFFLMNRLLDNSVLVRWAHYAKGTVLFPRPESVWQL
jgi:hypothetical protein